MVQPVEMPDGTILEFPDGMSHADMAAAIKTLDAPAATPTPTPAPPPAPEGSAWDRFRQTKFGENVVGYGEADTFGERLPANIKDVIRSTFGGAAKGTAALAGIPGSLGTLADKGIVTGINKMFGSDLQTSPSTIGIGPLTDAMAIATGGRSEYEPQTTAGEYGRTVGGMAPGAYMFGGASPANLLKFAFAPGMASEAAGQATEGTPYEPYARFAAAVATPAVLQKGLNVLQRIATPHPATAEATAAASTLDDAGVTLTPGRRTGSNRLKLDEKMTVAGEGRIDVSNRSYTESIMKSINSESPTASRAAISQAYDDIGGQFNVLANKYNAVADQILLDDAMAAVAKYADDATPAAAYPTKVIKDIREAFDSGVPLTGTQYQTMSSRLGEWLGSGNPEKIKVAGELRLALDDALERTIVASGNPASASALAQWKEARRLYTNLLIVSRAAGMAGGSSGQISPSALRASVKAIQGNRRLVTGNSELGPLADAGEVAFRSPYGVEANVRNLDMKSFLKEAGRGGGAGVAAGLYTGNPLLGVGVAGAGWALPAIKRGILNTGPGQKYLANQAFTSPAQAPMDPRLLGTIASGIVNQVR